MILKVKVKTDKNNKKKNITVWVQKHKEFNEDIQELLQFFKDQITYSIKSRILEYYKITSNNPAIMLSLLTSIQDLIAESCSHYEEPI